MKILNRQVLLEPILKESSVIITSDKPELTNKAVVKMSSSSDIKEGDIVIYNNRAGMPVEIDGTDYILTDYSNIYILF